MGLFSRELHTEIDIAARPERVWSILTDFGGYSEWNPFINKIAGTSAVGETIEVHFAAPGAKVKIFRPKLLAVENSRELRWLGQLLLPYLFDGEHFFIIKEIEGGTRFVQGEVFRGLLVPLFWQYLDTNTRSGFEKMNYALKARAEGGG